MQSSENKLYVIKSRDLLSQIEDCIVSNGGTSPQLLRIIYKKIDNKIIDCYKTLCLCSEKDINLLREEYKNRNTREKNTIESYDWNKFIYPSQTQTWNLHFTGFPKGWRREDAEQFISDKLDNICQRNLYKIFIPFNRETGMITGYGSIIFNDEVDEFTKKLTKLALHMTPIRDENDEDNGYISVSWRNDIKPQNKSSQSRRVGNDTYKKKTYPQENRTQEKTLVSNH